MTHDNHCHHKHHDRTTASTSTSTSTISGGCGRQLRGKLTAWVGFQDLFSVRKASRRRWMLSRQAVADLHSTGSSGDGFARHWGVGAFFHRCSTRFVKPKQRDPIQVSLCLARNAPWLWHRPGQSSAGPRVALEGVQRMQGVSNAEPPPCCPRT